ncbi:MAG: outer membrane lipoprotein carrier protein LolA [Candidatus Firestonebacteria bacterium]|nr:outer membrane lipoprotein carrier protein LolA [Candidatus Firestonebacteria bacterium]
MKLKPGLLLSLLLMWGPGVVWGDGDADAQRLAAVQKQTAALRSLAADFTSVKTVAFLSEPIRTHGHLLFEKPNRVAWEVTSPFKAAVVYDGRAALRYLADPRGHWTRQTEGPDPVLAETMRQLQMWLSGQAFASGEAYAITTEPGPPLKVRLVPKHSGLRKFISSLEMTFGEKLDVVRTLILTEGSGDTTRITFERIVINEPLPANEWFSEHASQP